MTSLEGGGDGQSQNLAQFWAEDQQLVKVLIGLFDTAESGVRPTLPPWLPRSPQPPQPSHVCSPYIGPQASEAILSNTAVFLGDLVEAGRKEAIEMQEFSTPSPFLAQLSSVPILTEILNNVLSAERSVGELDLGVILARDTDPRTPATLGPLSLWNTSWILSRGCCGRQSAGRRKLRRQRLTARGERFFVFNSLAFERLAQSVPVRADTKPR